MFRILSIQAILLVSASVQNHDRQSFVPFFRPSKVTVSTIVTLLPATIDFSPVALSAAVVWILFYRDLEEKIVYIAETLQNPQAANNLLDDEPNEGWCMMLLKPM